MPVSMKTKGLNEALKFTQMAIKQSTFAAALALTRTARIGVKNVKKQAQKDLQAPTPFTLRGFRWEKATKRKLEARVYIAPIQSNYMSWSVAGGQRRKRAEMGEALPVPGNVRLNKYGNIPGRGKGKIGEILAQPDTFVATIKGVRGIWQRGRRTRKGGFSRRGKGRKDTVRLLFRLEQSVSYDPQFKFQQTNEKSFEDEFDKQYSKAWVDALT